MRPLEEHHSGRGRSANIAYYHERGAEPREAYVWCSVLHHTPLKRMPDGSLRLDRGAPHTYHATVYRNGEGELASFTVERPRSRAPEALAARTVTRLVREAIGEDTA